MSAGSDLAIINAQVLSLDENSTRASAVAMKNGVIVYVGDTTGIQDIIGPDTETLDADGKTLVPGLIDSHLHPIWFGFFLQRLDLRETKSIDELKKKLAQNVEALEEGEWVLGSGWDQDRLVEGRYPDRWDLDEVSPNHPVLLHRICSHIAVANSEALSVFGIDSETSDPPGGRIDRDAETGEPTGIMRETALEEAMEKLPDPTPQEYLEAATRAMEYAASRGLTTLHFVSTNPEEFRACQELHRTGRLKTRMRLYVWLDWSDPMVELGIQRGLGDPWLRIQGVKLYTDGALGPRTALMREPYADDPENTGVQRLDMEELKRLVRVVDEGGLQLAIHAIGDGGVELALDALSEATGNSGNPLRHRIEHASLLAPDLIERMAKGGVLAAVQPRFIISDFWSVDRVGEGRGRWLYPFKTMVQEGVRVSFSSDCPIDPLDPIYEMYSALTRGRNEGIALYDLTADEALTPEEALRLYTAAGAYASHDEDSLGSIEVGKLADMVLLSQNPLETDPDDFLEIDIEATIVEGQIVYQKTASS